MVKNILREQLDSIINQTYPIYEIFYAFFAYRDCACVVVAIAIDMPHGYVQFIEGVDGI